jgi:hypothetical protein
MGTGMMTGWLNKKFGKEYEAKVQKGQGKDTHAEGLPRPKFLTPVCQSVSHLSSCFFPSIGMFSNPLLDFCSIIENRFM